MKTLTNSLHKLPNTGGVFESSIGSAAQGTSQSDTLNGELVTPTACSVYSTTAFDMDLNSAVVYR